MKKNKKILKCCKCGKDSDFIIRVWSDDPKYRTVCPKCFRELSGSASYRIVDRLIGTIEDVVSVLRSAY